MTLARLVRLSLSVALALQISYCTVLPTALSVADLVDGPERPAHESLSLSLHLDETRSKAVDHTVHVALPTVNPGWSTEPSYSNAVGDCSDNTYCEWSSSSQGNIHELFRDQNKRALIPPSRPKPPPPHPPPVHPPPAHPVEPPQRPPINTIKPAPIPQPTLKPLPPASIGHPAPTPPKPTSIQPTITPVRPPPPSLSLVKPTITPAGPPAPSLSLVKPTITPANSSPPNLSLVKPTTTANIAPISQNSPSPSQARPVVPSIRPASIPTLSPIRTISTLSHPLFVASSTSQTNATSSSPTTGATTISPASASHAASSSPLQSSSSTSSSSASSARPSAQNAAVELDKETAKQVKLLERNEKIIIGMSAVAFLLMIVGCVLAFVFFR
ncbi:hypothetical protein K474DRAFT_1670402 [Panus rudis PR-1116 ss-1]|nr:hypothetical protein K474DRAFT_1670402 [Panus rudis PR-1116 ss-1]